MTRVQDEEGMLTVISKWKGIGKSLAGRAVVVEKAGPSTSRRGRERKGERCSVSALDVAQDGI